MSALEIVHYPHPALRWKSKPIQRIDSELRKTVAAMFELMYEFKGIGLAANQVALPYRLFIVNPTGDPDEKDQEIVFINPEISQRKGSIEGEEGCLSLPDVYGQVRRASDIVVDAFDLSGQGFQCTLDDLPGRVVQHEFDHLEGVMFFDRMQPDGVSEIQAKIDDFEHVFRQSQKAGDTPSDEELKKRLKALEH
ncbi:MAG: peptide deformylase [Planctomycetaceae bacterium]|nr:peptide deformylase [Planctomycetaceae bacterium]